MRVSMHRLQWIHVLAASALIAAASGLTACGSSDSGSSGGSSGGSSESITIGASMSMTGSLGQFGVDQKAGYDQLVKDINAAGGIDIGGQKRQVSLVTLDNRSDPNLVTQQTRQLIVQNGAVAVLASCTPPLVVPGALVAEQQGVPFVSGCSPVNAFAAASKTGWKYAWDIFFSEKDQAAQVAKGLSTPDSNKKVALFTDTEPDGVVERQLYMEALQAAGLTVVGDYTFPVGTSDFSSFINDAKSKGTQLVAGQMIPPDGIALWKQIKSASLAPKAAFVAKAAAGQNWKQALGDVAEGTLSEVFWTPQTGRANSDALYNTIKGQFPDPSDQNLVVMGYTAAAVLADGLKRAGSTDAAKVNAALEGTDGDFAGGHVRFDQTHTSTMPYVLMQWHGEVTVQVVPPVNGVTFDTPTKGLQ